MTRDFNRLAENSFDLLVIGGGVYGAWTAFDAALRGLRVAIVEKNDWASGASSASSKLIHGGLRYLEQFRFGLVRKNLRERKRLAELAPHRINGMRFAIPVSNTSRVGRFRLCAGLSLYDAIAGGKQPVAPHKTFSRKEATDKYPFLMDTGLRTVFTYGDCQTDDARFVLELIAGACNAGAVALNYVRLSKLTSKDDRVTGGVVEDLYGRDSTEVTASVVVNTAGAWAGGISTRYSPKNTIKLTKGVHLVFPPLPTNDAMLLATENDRRMIFILPWYGQTLVGTTDTDYKGDPDDIRIDNSDIDYLLTEVNRYVRPGILTRENIRGGFAGLRALRNEAERSPSATTREWFLMEPCDGYLMSVGGKFTSARSDAGSIVDRVMQILKKPSNTPSLTETRDFPWKPRENFPNWKEKVVNTGIKLGLDQQTAAFTAHRYGTAIVGVFNLIEKNPDLGKRFLPELPFAKAELIYSAANEMVVHLDDLLRRRIPCMALTSINKVALEEAAALVANELGWTPEERETEVRAAMGKWT